MDEHIAKPVDEIIVKVINELVKRDQGEVIMKKKKWNKLVSVLLAMVTAVSLLSGCGGKSAEKEDAGKNHHGVFMEHKAVCKKICAIHPGTASGYQRYL